MSAWALIRLERTHPSRVANALQTPFDILPCGLSWWIFVHSTCIVPEAPNSHGQSSTLAWYFERTSIGYGLRKTPRCTFVKERLFEKNLVMYWNPYGCSKRNSRSIPAVAIIPGNVPISPFVSDIRLARYHRNWRIPERHRFGHQNYVKSQTCSRAPMRVYCSCSDKSPFACNVEHNKVQCRTLNEFSAHS